MGLLGLRLCFHGVEPPLPPSPPVSLLWLAPWRSSLHAWWLKSATRLCYAWAGVDGAAWAIWLCFHGVEPPLPPSPPISLLWLAPWRSSLHAWWLKSATRLCYAWAGVDGAAWAIWLCFHGVEPPSVYLLWLAPWRSSLHAWWLKSATRLCYAWAGVDGAAWAIIWLCFHGVEPPSVSLLWLAPWRSSLHASWLKSATCLCHAWAGVDGGCLGYMALLPWG
jgi:hypothetical protein